MSRSSAHADSPGVQLPAQQTYPVQQEAPLFTNALQAQASNDEQTTATNTLQTQTPPQAPAAAPLGTQDPGGIGFDVFDIGIKLAAVLGLAYGSL
ncbi:MAG: hypothetical protein E6I75_00915, partial [Chloroflexi bacterium]